MEQANGEVQLESDTILVSIQEIVSKILHVGTNQIGPETNLPALGLGSLKIIELTLALERRFGIEFADDALTFERFARPDAIVALLRESGVG